MSTNFIPFPLKMRAELASLETQKLSIIKGFLYSLDIEGNWSIANDLSGVHRNTTPAPPKITVRAPENSDGPGPMV